MHNWILAKAYAWLTTPGTRRITLDKSHVADPDLRCVRSIRGSFALATRDIELPGNSVTVLTLDHAIPVQVYQPKAKRSARLAIHSEPPVTARWQSPTQLALQNHSATLKHWSNKQPVTQFVYWLPSDPAFAHQIGPAYAQLIEETPKEQFETALHLLKAYAQGADNRPEVAHFLNKKDG